jgi:hypothetical protein
MFYLWQHQFDSKFSKFSCTSFIQKRLLRGGGKNLVSHAFCSSLINFDEFFYGIYEIWIFACEKCLLKIIKCWNDPIFAIKKTPKNIDFCRTLLEEVE